MEVKLELLNKLLQEFNIEYEQLDTYKYLINNELIDILVFDNSEITLLREVEVEGKKIEVEYMKNKSKYTILIGKRTKETDVAIICFPTERLQKKLRAEPYYTTEDFEGKKMYYVKLPIGLVISDVFLEDMDENAGYAVITNEEPFDYKIIKGFKFLREAENMSKKELAVVQEEKKDLANLTKDQIELLKRTVAKGATDDEFKIFLALAQKYDLDPFAKQIWFVKYKSSEPASIFTGRDGFLHIAHKTGQLDGMETSIEKVDEPLKVYDKYGKVVFESPFQYVATCKVYRKDMRHPIVVTVWEEEYNSGNRMWKTKRRTMIQKVAESQALRRAFDISGLYAPEEISDIEYVEPAVETTENVIEATATQQENPDDEVLNKLKNIVGEEPEEIAEVEYDDVDTVDDLFEDEEDNKANDVAEAITEKNKATEAQIRKLYAVVNKIAKLKGSSKDIAIQKIKEKFKVEHIHDISKSDMSQLIEGLEQTLKKLQAKNGGDS